MGMMKIVGLSSVNEGVSSKTNKPYKMRDVHLAGTSLDVNGSSVAKVTVNLLENGEKLPELILGGTYIVDLSDRGFLRNLELLEKPTPPQSGAKGTA